MSTTATPRQVSLKSFGATVLEEFKSLDNWAVVGVQLAARAYGVEAMLDTMMTGMGAPPAIASIAGAGIVMISSSIVAGAAVRVLHGQMLLAA